MIDKLLLLSGNDIPFPIAGITIHQPKLKEIALINEDTFWRGCQLLKFNKDILQDKVKNDLSNQSNFNIIMSMVQDRSIQSQKARINLLSILALIFPNYKIKLGNNIIQLFHSESQEMREINDDNFQRFKEILNEMFYLKENEQQYNPSGESAKRIAEQLMKGRQRKAKLAPHSDEISLLSRYASILAVGQQKDLNSLMEYTVYQIMDEFTRYQLKLNYDSWDRYRRAGATGLKDPEDWLKDIYKKQNEQSNNSNDILYKI